MEVERRGGVTIVTHMTNASPPRGKGKERRKKRRRRRELMSFACLRRSGQSVCKRHQTKSEKIRIDVCGKCKVVATL